MAAGQEWEFQAEVWRWEAQTGWFFCTLPFDVSDDIEERSASASRGFGSVRVRVRIGTTTWRTSVFPDKARKAYVLPLKKAVRTAEGLDEGSTVRVAVSLVDC